MAKTPKARLKQEFQAQVVIDSVILGSEEAAGRKHGVSPQSIRRWRKRVIEQQGPEALALSEAVATNLAKLSTPWEQYAHGAMQCGMKYLTAAAETMPKNSRNVRAIVGMVKIVGELLAAQSMVEARLKPTAPVLAIKPAEGSSPLKSKVG